MNKQQLNEYMQAEAFSDADGLTVTEIATAAEQTPEATWMLLLALQSEGYIQQRTKEARWQDTTWSSFVETPVEP